MSIHLTFNIPHPLDTHTTSHPGQLSLAIRPSVGRHNEYYQWLWPLLGKKTASSA